MKNESKSARPHGERDRSQSTLQHAYRELRQLVDFLPQHVIVLDAKGTLLQANQMLLDFYGRTLEEMQGAGNTERVKRDVHPDDLERVRSERQDGFAKRSPFEIEKRLLGKDGRYRWFLFRYKPMLNEEGAVLSWYATATDIEDRKRTESLLAAEMRTLQMIADGASLTDILNHVCTSVDRQISPSVTTILLMDSAGQKLWPTAGPKVPHDWTRAITPVPVAPDGGLCATAAFLKTRVIVPDVGTEPNWREEYRDVALRNGIRAAWSEPILTKENQVLGTFAVYSAESRVPTDADLALIEAAGRLALIAIERQRSQEALRSALDTIRKSEEELRRMIDAVAQTIVVLNPDGRVTYANRVALEYMGLSLDDVRADDFRARVFHPDDMQRVREAREKGLSGTVPFENEQRALGKDGKYRWFLIRYNPLLDESGRVIRWYATGTDIEDRKQAEQRMRNENLALREEIDRSSMYETIVGSSESLRQVLSQVDKVAPTDATVLILGETGTGKELVASAIHKRSKRSAKAFIRVNCAAIPPSLIASELFGHEKGAFTGALQRRAGRFESADGGTIFLDEIGELSPETQLALLRVLQERELERVGSNQPVPVDVRVVAATNRDLEAAVLAGRFRQDLFYRLNVIPIRVPPLRERKNDIPLLVEYLVERYARRAGKTVSHIEKKTRDILQAYDWPGNVRELQNVIERAVILCDGETFSVDETWLRPNSPQLSGRPISRHGVLAEDKKEFADRERKEIEAALAECDGRVSGPRGAAAILGIPHQTLESKIVSLGIDKRRFKAPSPGRRSD
jgi:formate hydrogenlyase transcriptional activator